ncbi:gamma-glutamyl-gamma-aminobutyrate hydrolase family protein [Halomonas faecis]|uniref:gamma-glutamyl-gamma-aminobutyrate hydrolase family protein n=1 Tax=Halomonas faecis TaxID=1562110 RepID=UPI0013D732E8|nr:gamma-glutamyl-gamma-aminobutyrate hydrolase family protein [Halomonas faecis]
MKRIAITPRRDCYPARDETRDALDTRLAARLWSWGFLPQPLASGVSDTDAYLTALAPEGFLLSGGNDIGSIPERDALETAALRYAATHCLPVVGICRGLQMINHYQGGELRTIVGHAATTHAVSGPLTGSRSQRVNSYHGLGVYSDTLGADLAPLAWAEDGSIEALRHTTLPWLGIMWHPERDTPTHATDQALITTLLNQGSLL